MATATKAKIDFTTYKNIMLLHPKLRVEAITIFEACNDALSGRAKVRFTSTLRTFEEQQALYDQGRTKPGKIVTNAKPGTSYHNFALAIDFTLIIDGKAVSWDTAKDWDNDKKSDWMEVVEIFKKYGWEWGGDWRTFKDLPHVQKTYGKSTKELLALYNSKKFMQEKYLAL